MDPRPSTMQRVQCEDRLHVEAALKEWKERRSYQRFACSRSILCTYLFAQLGLVSLIVSLAT